MLKNSEFYETLVDGIGEGINKPKADFDENDPKNPGYIKNRTHWKEEVPEKNVLICEGTQPSGNTSATDAWPLSEHLVAGVTYKMTVNGYVYSVVAATIPTGVALSLMKDSSNTIGSLYEENQSGKLSFSGKPSGKKEFKIELNEPAHTVYHPIDANYLPQNRTTYTVVVNKNPDTDELELSKDTPWEDLVKAYEGGCNLVLVDPWVIFDRVSFYQFVYYLPRPDLGLFRFGSSDNSMDDDGCRMYNMVIDVYKDEDGKVAIEYYESDEAALFNDLQCLVYVIGRSDGTLVADRDYDTILQWLNQGKNVYCVCNILPGSNNAVAGVYQLSGEQNGNTVGSAIVFERMVDSFEGLSFRRISFSKNGIISFSQVSRPFIKGVTDVYKSYHSDQLLAIASTSMGAIDSFKVVDPPKEYKVQYVNATLTELDLAAGKITGTADSTLTEITNWNTDGYVVYAKIHLSESLTSMIPLVSVASGVVDFQGVYYFDGQKAVKIRAQVDQNKKVTGTLTPLAEASQIGNLNELTTTSKENLVAAINEVKAGGGSGGASDAVLYTEQSLTKEQQAQARENIGSGVAPYYVAVNRTTGTWGTVSKEQLVEMRSARDAGKPIILDMKYSGNNAPRYLPLIYDGGEWDSTLDTYFGYDRLGMALAVPNGGGALYKADVFMRASMFQSGNAGEALSILSKNSDGTIEFGTKRLGAQLPELSASVDIGLIPCVDGWDSYRYMAWKKPDEIFSGGAGAWYVKITQDDDGNITSDKTPNEIREAYEAGYAVYAEYSDIDRSGILSLSAIGLSTIFTGTISVFGSPLRALVMYVNGAWSAQFSALGNVVTELSNTGTDEEVPSAKCVYDTMNQGLQYAIPIAQQLGISGAQAGQLAKIKTVNEDGNPTSWEAVDMPSGTDLSLGLTSASVGQIIKVKAVDEDGKPTEWETAEMAGGESSFPKFEKLLTYTITEEDIAANPAAYMWNTTQIPNLNDYNVFTLTMRSPDGTTKITLTKWVVIQINGNRMGSLCGTREGSRPSYAVSANRLYGYWVSESLYNPINFAGTVLTPPHSSTSWDTTMPASEAITKIGFTSYGGDYGLVAGIIVEIWGAK